jgi:deoxycytidine triphosphate deaminase
LAVTLDPEIFWRDPGIPTPATHWQDPEPAVRGMLSGDRVEGFAADAAMIEPFTRSRLKTAAYRLTIGRWYQVEGVDGVLTPEHPRLVIPKNSLAFVSVAERLRLPHYIAARFNLKIDYVYRGLLLGTGPQVDPGFQGILSFPLHNLSNNPIPLDLGDNIATIDFVKTTGLPPTLRTDTITTEDELYERARQNNVALFDRVRRWIKPISGYQLSGLSISSSVKATVDELDKRVSRVESVDRWTIIGIGVAVVASVVAFASINWAMFQSQQSLTKDAADRTVQINHLQDNLTTATGLERTLRSCVAALASANAATKPSPVPSSCSSP